MNILRLLRLEISNFKGLSSFSLNLEGHGAVINGSNGTGKTTLCDAYTWLLFGKDSSGRSDSSFDVKPYGVENPIVTVTGEFAANDGAVRLTRQLAEKTVRQRGTDETSIKNEYKFFINDVPKTKTLYDEYIAQLCPPEYFRMLSDPDFFAGKLAWGDRRETLTRLFGNPNESELLDASDKWTALRNAADGMSIADYRAKTTAERKKIKAELDVIPDRILEAERAIPQNIESFDPAALKSAMDALSSAEQEMQNVTNGVASVMLRQQIAEAKTALAQSRATYLSDSSNNSARTAAESIERQMDQLRDRQYTLQCYCSAKKLETERLDADLSYLRSEWRDISALEWNAAEEACPCCGQQFPRERICEMRESFNERKAAKLERNVADGKAKAEALEHYRAELADAEEQLSAVNVELNARREELEQAKAQIINPPPFETTDEYRAGMNQIDALTAELFHVETENKTVIGKLQSRINVCSTELDRLREQASLQDVAKRQTERVKELKMHSRKLGKLAAELDRALDAAASFEQYKLTAIEDSINARFKYAKFRLFDRQLNGGYSECCEVVVDGAPYSTNLNPGKKINAGLDIIETLSGFIGFSAPVWIDNAESYVRLMKMGAQIIRLRVESAEERLTVVTAD